MNDLLNFLVTRLVDKPEMVRIDENIQDGEFHVYTIHVDNADMGKIIGKDGKIIRSIRVLSKVLAIKQNLRISVELAEERLKAEEIGSAT